MSTENEPTPTNVVIPISTLEDAEQTNQSIFYDTSWASSNYAPVPSMITPWTAPVVPSTTGIGYLYMKTGSTDLFFSTNIGGETNILAGGGAITGPANSTADAIVRWSGTSGTVIKNTPSATIDDSGNITATSYKIGSNTLLSAGVLGSSVTASSLTSAAAMNINTGQVYAIAGVVVLSASTLGSSVTTSSLTTVSALTSGSIASGFGSINIGGNTVTCGSAVVTSIAATTTSSTSYRIATDTVLSAGVLGSTVTASSLQSVGVLSGLAVGGTADSSAILTVTSTSQGALLPRMTTAQKNAISSPATGLLLYDTTLSCLSSYSGSSWVTVGSNVPNTIASINLNTGLTYQINSTTVLSSTTLGSGVTFSSLTSLGVLNGLAIGGTADSSAILTVTSTSQGAVLPRMTTTQKNAISVPATGMLLYDTTLGCLSSYSGSAWVTVGSNVPNTSTSVNLNTGLTYQINSTAVLSSTTLGSTVTASSLTTVGVLNGLAIGGTADSSAILNVTSTSKGAVLPRMTTAQKNAISSPATGLLVYDTTLSCLSSYSGSSWVTVGSNILNTIASINLNTGLTYQINSVDVLSSTTLGSGVTASSLTTVGILSSLAIGAAADASAILTVTSPSNNKGALLPSMTTAQKNAISSPATGLLVYDTTLGCLSSYSGSAWVTVGSNVPNTSTSVNLNTGLTYQINSVDVLSSTTLGSGVTASSLTTVGVLSGLAVGSTAASSAILTVTSTSQGALLPRMTTAQKNAISAPATGLLLYDTTLLALHQYNGSAWGSVAASNVVVVAITSANTPYTLTTTTEVLVCTNSSGTTPLAITLPTAIGNSGKIFRFVRTDTTLATTNAITITGANPGVQQTIGGSATRYMWTTNEDWIIVSDNANWQVIAHTTISPIASESIVVRGTTSGTATVTTSSINKITWRRIGSCIEVWGLFKGATGVEPVGDYIFNIPQSANLTINTTNLTTFATTGTLSGAGTNLGNFMYSTPTTAVEIGLGNCILYDNKGFRALLFMSTNPAGTMSRAYLSTAKSLFTSANAVEVSWHIMVPITNFDP